MKQKATGKKQQTGEHLLPVMGGIFLLAAVAGSLCCIKIPRLQQWLLTELQESKTIPQTFLSQLLYLMAILPAGFLGRGAVFAWLAIGVKGFFLSAESTALVLNQGNTGYLLTLANTLLPQLFSVAAIILLGRQAVDCAHRRIVQPSGKSRRRIPDSPYFLTVAVCTLLMLLSALVKVRVSPALEAAVWSLLSA